MDAPTLNATASRPSKTKHRLAATFGRHALAQMLQLTVAVDSQYEEIKPRPRFHRHIILRVRHSDAYFLSWGTYGTIINELPLLSAETIPGDYHANPFQARVVTSLAEGPSIDLELEEKKNIPWLVAALNGGGIARGSITPLYTPDWPSEAVRAFVMNRSKPMTLPIAETLAAIEFLSDHGSIHGAIAQIEIKGGSLHMTTNNATRAVPISNPTEIQPRYVTLRHFAAYLKAWPTETVNFRTCGELMVSLDDQQLKVMF